LFPEPRPARIKNGKAKSLVSTPVITAVVSLVGLCGVLAWRVREGRAAVTMRKIVMPPLGMATGFCMFIVPAFRVPWAWAIGALLVGAIVLAYPLLLTSDLHYQNGVIMMKRSSMFFAVIIVLAIVRYAARSYFDRYLTLEQTGALFYLLAFGMIVRWRAKLFFAYRALTSGSEPGTQAATGEAPASE
jgi:membrane protein CcdC involved in cytochrome C biogenesis